MAIKTEERRCLQEESVYNPKTGSCRRCSACRYGEGRNFSQSIDLKGRVNKCPPCKICPDGYFNNDMGRVTCRRCVVNCMERHRHVTRECTPVHDAACGSCRKGFTEVYHNTDLPCWSKPFVHSAAPTSTMATATTSSIAIAGTTTAVDKTAPFIPIRHQSNSTIRMTQNMVFRPEHQEEPRIISATTISGICIFLLVVLFALRQIKKRRGLMSCSIDATKKFRVMVTNISESYTPVAEVENVNDLETDAAHSTHNNNSIPERNPRPELSQIPESIISGPHPELSAMAISQATTVPVKPVLFYPTSQVCSCRLVENDQQCQFRMSKIEPFKKGSPILYYVASKICHNPLYLYQSLGIPEEEIYQIDDDRNRDPIRIKEKENVLNILNRWVELHGNKATKQFLCEALCKARFHHIHENIQKNLSISATE